MVNSVNLNTSRPFYYIMKEIEEVDRSTVEFDSEWLDEHMAFACEEINIFYIKELLKMGASYKQALTIDSKNWLKFYGQSQDDEYLHQQLLLGIRKIKGQVEGGFALEYLKQIETFLAKGERFSVSFMPHSLGAVQEVLCLLTPSLLLDTLMPTTKKSLVRAAFDLRDLELIKLLVERELNLKNLNFQKLISLDPQDFTQISSEIAGYLIGQGIPLKRLIAKDQSPLSLLANAQKAKNQILVDFLKEQGIGVENLKFNPNAIAC